MRLLVYLPLLIPALAAVAARPLAARLEPPAVEAARDLHALLELSQAGG